MSLIQSSEIEKLVEKAVATAEETITLSKPKRQILFNAIKGVMDEVLGEVWNDGYREGKKNASEQYNEKLKELKETVKNWGNELG